MLHSVASSYHYDHHIVELKRQNRLIVGTNKPKLKVKMQSVAYQMMMSGRLLEKPRFELAAMKQI